MSDADTEEEQEEEEEWKDPELLDRLINEEGKTYGEIAEMIDADEDEIGRFARKNDLNWSQGYRSEPTHQGSTVPVGHRAPEVEIPIPAEVVQRYNLATVQLRVPKSELGESPAVGDVVATNDDGDEFVAAKTWKKSVDIEPAAGYLPPAKFPDFGVNETPEVTGSLVRFVPVLEHGEIKLLMDMGATKGQDKRIYANERRLIHRESNYHMVAVLPRPLAYILGLHREVDTGRKADIDPRSRKLATGRMAEFDFDRDLISISFDPILEPWDPGPETKSSDVLGLMPTYGEDTDKNEGKKPLHPLRAPDVTDLTPEVIEKYQMGLPFGYHNVYGIDPGDELVVRVGEIDGQLAIVYDVETDPETVDEHVVRKVTHSTTQITSESFKADNADAEDDKDDKTKGTQYENTRIIYPPKALVHGLGLGIDVSRPMVRLLPGDGYFALKPLEVDGYGKDIELYDPRKARSESVDDLDVEGVL